MEDSMEQMVPLSYLMNYRSLIRRQFPTASEEQIKELLEYEWSIKTEQEKEEIMESLESYPNNFGKVNCYSLFIKDQYHNILTYGDCKDSRDGFKKSASFWNYHIKPYPNMVDNWRKRANDYNHLYKGHKGHAVP